MPRNLPVRKDPLAEYALPAVVKGTQRPVPLVATSFSVRIVGGLALVVTERTFRNAEKAGIEATMTFPVPVHATLLGLKATIGDRVVVGSAQRRQQARETYESAIDSGMTAVLHEEVLRGVHMVSVGHVPPGTEIKVSATWGMPMAADRDGTATLRIPVTVGDVYGRSPLPESDDLVHSSEVHEATVEVASADGVARLRGIALLDGSARVTLDAPLDVIVSDWSPRALRGVAADGRAVALGIVPAPSGALPLDAAILVDHSGSMDDPADGSRKDYNHKKASKHDVVVTGLRVAAATVRDRDDVDLWEFDNTAEKVGGRDLAAAVGKLNAPQGGTATGQAISQVLAGRATRDVILLTDGKSHDLDVQKAARSGRRFHVVLIGEDSLEANMGHLAALTGGQVFVVSGEDSGEAISKAFAAAREPHVATPHIEGSPTSVETRIGGMAVRAAWGPSAADDAKVVGIVIPTMIEGANGKKADAVPSVPAMGPLVEGSLDPEMGRAVAAVAAALAIPGMKEEAAAALAEAEGIVCHLTSLVLVDEAGEKQEGVPAQRKVATMTPRTHGLMAFASAAPSSFASKGITRGLVTASLEAVSGHSMLSYGGSSRSMWKSDGEERVGNRSPSFGGGKSIFGELPDLEVMLPKPPKSPKTPAPSNADLSFAMGRIDWSASPEALRKGDLGGLASSVSAAILRASLTSEVKTLALFLGISAVATVVALLAKHEGATDRGAARVARALLANADATLQAAAEKSVGL
jgi:hypothetical protein